jgi:hypothetical protein
MVTGVTIPDLQLTLREAEMEAFSWGFLAVTRFPNYRINGGLDRSFLGRFHGSTIIFVNDASHDYSPSK